MINNVDIDLLVAMLDAGLDVDEAAIAERMIGEIRGTMPDRQLVEEIGLAIAIHRRQR